MNIAISHDDIHRLLVFLEDLIRNYWRMKWMTGRALHNCAKPNICDHESYVNVIFNHVLIASHMSELTVRVTHTLIGECWRKRC